MSKLVRMKATRIILYELFLERLGVCTMCNVKAVVPDSKCIAEWGHDLIPHH